MAGAEKNGWERGGPVLARQLKGEMLILCVAVPLSC
jgi:hypothetical protein